MSDELVEHVTGSDEDMDWEVERYWTIHCDLCATVYDDYQFEAEAVREEARIFGWNCSDEEERIRDICPKCIENCDPNEN